jgi:hypothetical protein
MIRYDGQEYISVRRFDCVVISLINEYGVGFFTSLPISPLEYRESNPTKAKVIVIKNKVFTRFVIIDDYGKEHYIDIDNEHKKIINEAINKAKDNKLLKDIIC